MKKKITMGVVKFFGVAYPSIPSQQETHSLKEVAIDVPTSPKRMGLMQVLKKQALTEYNLTSKAIPDFAALYQIGHPIASLVMSVTSHLIHNP